MKSRIVQAMGYTREHTEETRERILTSAARLFRTEGYDGARIDEIMAGAGLTRGGFYLHFSSKEELFAEYVGRELDLGRQVRASRERDPAGPLRGAGEAIDFYLTPGNRKRVARGCTIVSNAADVARSTRRARKAFTRAFSALRAEFAELATGRDDPDAAGLAALATAVGGVVLARAIDDPATVEALLAACRSGVDRELSG